MDKVRHRKPLKYLPRSFFEKVKLARVNPSIRVVPYSDQYKARFRELNLEWIEKYFQVEDKDRHQLENPEICRANGGALTLYRKHGYERAT